MNLHTRLLKSLQGEKGWLISTLFSGFASSILTVGQAYLISLIVYRVFLQGFHRTDVHGLLLWLLLLLLCRGFLASISTGSAEVLAVRIKHTLRSRLLRHLEDLGPAYIQREKSGEWVNTLTEGVEALDPYLSQYIPQLALSALIPLSILFIVFPLDPLSAIILLITAPLIPFFMVLIGQKAQAMTDRQYHRLSTLAAHFFDSLQGMTTLKLFGRAKQRRDSIAKTSDQYRKTTMGVLQVTFLSALALELLATVSTALVAVQIGLRLLSARLTFLEAFFILMITPEFYLPLRQLGLKFHAGMEGVSAAHRIFEILDTAPQNRYPVHPTPAEGCPFHHLRFDHVHFSYPGEEQPVLQGINFSLREGEHIALVGSSGAGKTTIAHLLLGFYAPDEGNILINDHPMHAIDVSHWRSQIAWVPQEPTLFHDTIAANLRIADPEADHQALVSAARSAHLHTAISAFPEGYQTIIGEEGLRLSGGEAQRLALARAFVKDAPLLILDEPTSQLDPVTETQLHDATQRLMVDRSVITIAHRLNTTYRADRILVMDRGVITEKGTHSELINRDGTYKKLIESYTRGGSQRPSLDPAYPPEASPTKNPGKQAESDLHHQFPTRTSAGTDKSAPSPLQIFSRLLGFLKPVWSRVSLSILLSTLTIGSSIGLMGSSAWLISTAALQPPLSQLNVAIVGVRFFGISRGIARYFERLTTHDVTFRMLAELRNWYYSALEPLAPARLMRYRAGDLLNRLISDIKMLEEFYVRAIVPPVVAFLVTTTMGIYLGTFDPQLGWILFFFMLAAGLGVPLLTQDLSRHPASRVLDQKAELKNRVVDYVRGLADLTAMGAKETYRMRCLKANQTVGSTQRKLGWIHGLNQGLSLTLTTLGIWTLMVSAIPMVKEGTLPGVLLAGILMMAMASFEAVQPLDRSAHILSSSLKAGKRLWQVISESPHVTDPSRPETPPKNPGITVDNLHFAYPGEDQKALCGISFDLHPGQRLALVGPSGGGKTTLLNLLLRFWDDPTRSINLTPGEVALNDCAQRAVRGLFNVVPQRSYFFHETVMENLKLARPKATQEEVIAAAKKAGIHHEIIKLSQGYETVLGERGSRLSSGERRRLAIARAYLKNGPIFLLDEPTANLDPVTERRILNHLFQELKGKTVLMITHRLIALDHLDQILVLDRGKIVERGTHQVLLRQKDLYHRMWTLQHQMITPPP